MMKEEKTGKLSIIKKDFLILVSITVLIFLIHILQIRDFGILYFLDDEYGYWGNAAYLAGLNWSDTVSKIPYYSYGYSILLVHMFWIFDNTIYMYKLAIVLNGIMLSASFLICYDIATKIMNNVNKYIIISISFLISMYPTYIVYSHVAWSECMLMFVFWLLTWCFVGINEKTNIYKFYLIGFLSGYIYIIHQRTLGILIASITVILLMKIFNKINIKQLMRVYLPIVFLLIIGFYIKNNIQGNLWLNGNELSMNDYTGQINKINQILSINGITNLVKIFIGHFFYLGVSSYLIFYFGLYELIQKSVITIKALMMSKTSNTLYTDDKFYVYMFLTIAIASTMTISAIFFINPISIDEIVYGRYNEIVLGPIILIGFTKLLKNKNFSTKFLLQILTGFSILTVLTDLIIKQSSLNFINTAQSVGIFIFKNAIGCYLPAAIVLMLFSLMWILFSKMNKKIIVITIALLSIFFFILGESGARSLAIQNQEMMKILKVTNIITSTPKNLPVYFLCNDPDIPVAIKWNSMKVRDRSVADCYQFILKDKNIKPVSSEELNKISGDKFVITTTNIDFSDFIKDYILLENDEGSFLYISK